MPPRDRIGTPTSLSPPNGARRGQACWSSYAIPRRQKLLQRTVDRSELFVEVRSDAVNHGDNGQRDAGCNQTVFNRRGARFIGQKIQQVALQFCLLRVKGW